MPTHEKLVRADATQWDGSSPIDGVITEESQVNNPGIKAIVASGKAAVRINGEWKIINSGDWIVKTDGGVKVYTNSEFTAIYEELETVMIPD